MKENIDIQIRYMHVIVSREEFPEDIDLMIDWCRENCEHNWAYGLQHSGPGGSIEYAFYFDNKIELVGFSLIWGLD